MPSAEVVFRADGHRPLVGVRRVAEAVVRHHHLVRIPGVVDIGIRVGREAAAVQLQAVVDARRVDALELVVRHDGLAQLGEAGRVVLGDAHHIAQHGELGSIAIEVVAGVVERAGDGVLHHEDLLGVVEGAGGHHAVGIGLGPVAHAAGVDAVVVAGGRQVQSVEQHLLAQALRHVVGHGQIHDRDVGGEVGRLRARGADAHGIDHGQRPGPVAAHLHAGIAVLDVDVAEALTPGQQHPLAIPAGARGQAVALAAPAGQPVYWPAPETQTVRVPL
jgi:hypothetical protein